LQSSLFKGQENGESWIRPDLPPKCTWHANNKSQKSPHCHYRP